MDDLIVIGGGPAGYTAAIYGAVRGLRTVLVESGEIGGVCLNRGCIPLKTLLATRGAAVAPAQRCEEVRNLLVGGVTTNLKRSGVRVMRGRASMETPGVVTVDDDGRTTLHGRCVLAASGSRPRVPGCLPSGDPRVMTADDFLRKPAIPRSCVIVGAGHSGVELAQALRGHGSEVTLVEMEDRILPTVDPELARPLRKRLDSTGIRVYTSMGICDAAPAGEGVGLCLSGGDELCVDAVIVAAGRCPNLEWADWDALGIVRSGDCIAVDRRCRTTQDAIAAAGDIVGPWRLAHSAYEQGRRAVKGFLGECSDLPPAIEAGTPRVVYGDLDIVEAGVAGQRDRIGRFPFCVSGRAATLGETTGLAKVAVDEEGVITSVGIVGREVAELADLAGFLVQNRVSAERYFASVHPHPTLGEAVAEAVGVALGVSVHRLGASRIR